MSLQKSHPQNILTSMPGDFVRIVVPGGAGDPIIRRVATGAFGTVTELPEGGRSILLHEFMPADIRVFGKIDGTSNTVVERISVDNEGDIALIAFEYLQKLSAQLQVQVIMENQRAVLMAALQGDARRIAEKMSANGYAVVEQVITETKTMKKIFITTEPENLRDALREGRPVDTQQKIFDLPPQTEQSHTEDVTPIDHALEALFVNSSVGRQTPLAMTPLLRGLAGNSELSLDDFEETGLAPHM